MATTVTGMPELQLDDFQHDVLAAFDRWHGRGIYADDMGGRKTATTLTWLERTEAVKKVLVLVPKAVHVDHWLAEAAVWSPSLTPKRGMGPKRLGVLHGDAGPRSIYVTTYASARIDEIDLRLQHFDTVVFDEGHALKGRTTQVAKMANQLAKAAHCLIVTGTPVMNKPEEMWQYLHMLYPKDFKSYWRWVEEHFHISFANFDKTHPWNQTKIVGAGKENPYLEGHEEIVRAQLSGCIIQREIATLFPGEVWVEEPEFTTYPVEMAVHERTLYDHLVEKGWGKTPTGLILTRNALTVQTRLRQLVSDWTTLDHEYAAGAKMQFAVEDIAKWHADKGRPVIVFVSFVKTAHMLAELLRGAGLLAEAFTGQETAGNRAAILKGYKLGHVDVIVGTYAAMSEGLDGLQYKTNLMALYDLDWVPGVVDQAIGRLKRSGQTWRVEVRHYFYTISIEQAILNANRRKINMVKYLANRDVSDIVYGHLMYTPRKEGVKRNDDIVLVEGWDD